MPGFQSHPAAKLGQGSTGAIVKILTLELDTLGSGLPLNQLCDLKKATQPVFFLLSSFCIPHLLLLEHKCSSYHHHFPMIC